MTEMEEYTKYVIMHGRLVACVQELQEALSCVDQSDYVVECRREAMSVLRDAIEVECAFGSGGLSPLVDISTGLDVYDVDWHQDLLDLEKYAKLSYTCALLAEGVSEDTADYLRNILVILGSLSLAWINDIDNEEDAFDE